MVPGAVLRKKWKYLRDQFSVECSKIKTPRSGDAAETVTESKWPYFKSMLFLKDIVRPRASSSNLKPKAPTATDYGEDKREDNINLHAEEEEKDNDDLNETENPNENETETQTAELNQPANPPPENPRKRRRMMANNTFYNERILQLEQQKLNTIQSVFQREPENDDMMFFKSLLPFISKIPTERKLRFRSRIQEVVEEFAFMEPLQQQPSPGPSTCSRPTPLPSPALSTTSYHSRPSPVDNSYHQMLPVTQGQGVFQHNQDVFPGTLSQNKNLYDSEFENNFN